jgi:LPXTG-site transpeptidase (sortase) family protein
MQQMKWIVGIALLILLFGCGNKVEKTSIEETESALSAVTEQTQQETKVENKSITKAETNGPLKEEITGITPQSIEIPAIGVKAEIENVGRIENGQMGVPEGMDTVGWFEPGPLPGERGNAVMAGHVDSKTGPAVFYKLDQLKKGDEIIVKSADGESKTFVVTGMESYPRKDAPVEDIFDFSYSSNLNLITCTGDFDRQAKTHEERLVVYTSLKGA